MITRRCNHIGRVGAWVQLAADDGMIAIATCNSPIHGHFVLPWGGREGRLGTNPIAYAIPTGGDPIVADFSTSVAPEGKIRFYRNEQKKVPDGWIVDPHGNPTQRSKRILRPATRRPAAARRGRGPQRIRAESAGRDSRQRAGRDQLERPNALATASALS